LLTFLIAPDTAGLRQNRTISSLRRWFSLSTSRPRLADNRLFRERPIGERNQTARRWSSAIIAFASGARIDFVD
jgi:hypothetical protein